MEETDEYNLTKGGAAIALREGKRLTHRYFSDNEWVEQKGQDVIFEDGAKINIGIFWSDRRNSGWINGWKSIDKSLIK